MIEPTALLDLAHSFVRDADNRIAHWSRGAEQLYGWTSAEAVGQLAHELLGTQFPLPLAEIEAQLRDSGSWAGDLVQRRRDGTPLTVHSQWFLQRHPDGRPAAVLEVNAIAAARQPAPAAPHLALALESARIVAWTWDFRQQSLAVSGKLAEIYGTATIETAEQALALIHPADRDPHRQLVRQAIATRQPYHGAYRVVRPDNGQTVWLEERGVPLTDSNGELAQLIGLVQDVTGHKQLEQSLRESEVRLRQITENIREVFYISDLRQPEMLYVSPAYEEIWGRACADLYAQPLSFIDSVAPEYQPRVRETLARQQQGEPTEMEYEIVRPDGTRRWIRDRSFPLRDEAGQVYRVIGVAEEFTEHIHAEALQRTRTRQQACLAELGQLALAEPSLYSVIDAVVRRVAETLEVEYCKVLELLPDRQALRLIAGVGWQPGLVGQATVSAGLESQAGYTLISDRPVVVDDLRRETRFSGPPLLHEHGVVSGISAIIRGHTATPFGVIGAHTTRHRPFTQDDANFLQSVANVLAHAIERARLYQAEQQAREQAERAADRMARLQAVTAALAEALTPAQVAQVLVNAGVPALHADAGVVAALTPDGQATEPIAQAGYAPGLVERWGRTPVAPGAPAADVVLTGEPIFIHSQTEMAARYPSTAHRSSDTGYQGRALVPLAVRGTVRAVLVLSFRQPQLFSPADRDYILGLARLAGQAIERTELYAAEQAARLAAEQAAEYTARLQRVTAALAHALSSAEVTRVIVEQSAAALGAGASAIYLADEAQEYLTLTATVGYPQTVKTVVQRLPLSGNMPAADVWRSRQALWLSSNAELLARYPFLADTRAVTGYEALAVIPLLIEERALGVLALSFAQPRAFPAEEADFLLTLAGQCALALERARLYDAEQTARAAASLLAEVGKALASTLDYHATLDNVARLTLPRLGDYCAVYVLDEAGQVEYSSVAHARPERTPLLQEWNVHYRPGPGNPGSLIGQVLRTGQPLFLPHVPESALDPRLLADTEPGSRFRHFRPRSILTVPLQARGKVLGAIALAWSETEREYAPADLALAEEVAHRAALALDNARLYAEAQALAAGLEQRVQQRTAALEAANAELQREIRERQQAEAGLRLHSQMLAHMAEGVALIRTSDATVALANPKFEAMFGYGPGELIGKPVHQLNAPTELDPQAVAQAIIATLWRDGVWSGEVHNVRKDGTPFWCWATVSTIEHAEYGQCWVAIHTDITDRKAADTELRQSRQLLQDLAARQEALREDERQRIAREIHDELGGALTGLKMDVAQLRKAVPEDAEAALGKLNRFSQALDETITTVRRIATDLRPAVLDDFGLLAALEWQLQEFGKRSGLACQFACGVETLELDRERATAVFRIVQEALTNVARHAQATEVKVSLAAEDGHLVLQVQDNGRGLAPDRLLEGKSLGLAGMRERTRVLAGEFDIQGTPGQGTVVLVRIPLLPN